MIENIKINDPELYSSMLSEYYRQKNTIELIASENIVSTTVLEAMGSVLTNKYAEGYPGNRYYGGCQFIDEIENLAIKRVKKLFGCNFANVQPHSGSQANFAALQAIAKPGDTILSLDLNHGGHLTHGNKANFSGKLYKFVFYSVNEYGFIDFDDLEAKIKEFKPKVVIAGASAYPREIDFSKFREIIDKFENKPYLLVDMAHIAGLVVAGLHISPIPYADIVTSTTHKTLRGPRGGIILTNDEKLAKKIDSSIFPGTQGGPLENIIAAKAVCFKEAMESEFISYQRQLVLNCKTLSNELLKRGFNLVTGGTDNHLLLVDLRNFNITGKELESRLDRVGITLNKNMVPGDDKSPKITSGVRIGTAAITTRGFKETDMPKIAELIELAILRYEESEYYIREEVNKLCTKYDIY